MVNKSPSRSHGEGSISRSDYTRSRSGVTVERWVASLDLGVGPNGKRLRKRITGPTRKAVADKLRELQRQQDAGGSCPPRDRPLGHRDVDATRPVRCGRGDIQRTTTSRPYQGKLMIVDPVILASARKHGITDDDMLHAYRHPIRVFDLDDLDMLVGADTAGRMLEIGVTAAEGVEFIVHAMAARPKFLET
jgi:hypothetical protein